MEKIKIILVEDDPDWIRIMTDFINNCDDLEICAVANTKEQAVKVVGVTPADVVLMDINLSENKQDGVLAALEILQQYQIKIVMLTSLNIPEIITDSFTAGAIDYVLKDNYSQLPAIIRRVANETTPMEILLKEYSRLKREEQLQTLTTAEREVFELLEAGYTLEQIENKLYKTHNTLKTQLKKILSKLNVRTRVEALKKIASKGILHKYSDND